MLIEQEFEKKMMLTEKAYLHLKRLFAEKSTRSYEQVNFYYDTSDNSLRSQNVTLRIRQKDQTLTGTKKTHHAGTPHSTEEHFPVSFLPKCFCMDGKQVLLKGALRTKRMEIPLTRDATLFLDENSYLGITDYELEIEYTAQEAGAKLLWQLLQHTVGERTDGEAVSKSERFFRQLTQKERRPDHASYS